MTQIYRSLTEFDLCDVWCSYCISGIPCLKPAIYIVKNENRPGTYSFACEAHKEMEKAPGYMLVEVTLEHRINLGQSLGMLRNKFTLYRRLS